MEELWKDIRYGARILRSSPGFTVIGIATLALGIGANTALFSVVNGVLLQPLPFSQPDRLVVLYEHRAQFLKGSISYPNFLDWKRNNRSFENIVAFRTDDFSLTGLGEAERVNGAMVSAGFFSMLGVPPLLGRDLDPGQDHFGGRPEVLISAKLWQEKFAAAPSVLSTALRLNGIDYTIVGVVPSGFHLEMWNFHGPRDVYVPIGQWNDPLFRKRNVGTGMNALARLKPGVTVEQARSDMSGVAQELGRIYPGDDAKVGCTVVPLKEGIVGDVRPFLLVLLAAVFFVLLIACANVSNLLLARSMSRSREFAIRIALGAPRRRVIRQLLTESMMLALAGGVLGLIVAAWGTPAVLELLPNTLPRIEQIRLDAPVLLFTVAVSLLAGIFFGMAPALRSLQPSLQSTLREGGRGASAARSRTQSIFVAVEMAMALALLAGAGLMLRSLAELWNVDPGFRPNHVLQFSIALPPSMNRASPDAIRAELRRVHQEIASVPGVLDVSMQRGSLPMDGDSDDPIWIGGQPKPARESEMPWALWYEVEPDYFKTMGIALRRGRLFTAADSRNSNQVAVIDESFAEKFFRGRDPIGQVIHDELLGRSARIVGVVGHVKQWGLDDKLDLHAEFYIPFAQIADAYMPRACGVLVRTAGPPLALLDPIRRQVERANGEEVVFDAHPYAQIVARSLSDRSFTMALLGLFAALALALSSIGIYGVVSHVVGQRTQEIGIRMALGAERRHVFRLVLGQIVRTVLFGVGGGIVLALGLAQLMSSVLFGVSAADPLTFACVALVLTAVALIASYIPARRAMRVDPVIALRYE